MLYKTNIPMSKQLLYWAIFFLLVAITFGTLMTISIVNITQKSDDVADSVKTFGSIVYVGVFAPLFGISLLISTILFFVYYSKKNMSMSMK